ncbi:hypothetical protein EC973_000187 [Apophysomyces ossiformis]|uniref:Leucine-rich repeat-containing protein 40 n=1 Tax=Apophysomyces ossiformis TaxID=679940 RepID=A0A8H7ETL2_9FUNG|nr:hypothetical protein EC973_000187 [Apophysomyces ossiformis]
MSTRRSIAQPRPTKASLLRTGGQQAKPTNEAVTTTKSEAEGQKSTTASSPRSRASEGVRAFMAQQRARKAELQKTNTNEEETPRPRSARVMTGAERYTDGPDANRNAAFGQDEPQTNRKLQTIIRQAKSSGKLNISSRGLDKIPEEVLAMYHVDPNSIVVDFSSSGDAWYDYVELTKFIATDNAITEIDERLGEEFGALTLLDIRSNQLRDLPSTLARLRNLTVLHFSHNQFEKIPDVLCEMPQIKHLDFAHNQIASLPSAIGQLQSLEVLHVEHNQICSLPDNMGNLRLLRKLYLTDNKLTELPVSIGQCQKLDELFVDQNKLKLLFPVSQGLTGLPCLSRLDARQNNINRLTDHESSSDEALIQFPKLKELMLSHNKLAKSKLTELKACPELQTLDISWNGFEDLPDAILSLQQLQRLDIGSNHLKYIRADLCQLPNLSVINWEGNTLRSISKTTTTAALLEMLRQNLTLEEKEQPNEETIDGNSSTNHNENISKLTVTDKAEVPQQQATKVVKVLQLAGMKLNELTEETLRKEGVSPATVQLDRNELTRVPSSLSLFAETLVNLNLEHNQITEFSINFGSVFGSLKTLNLSNNRITTIITEGSQDSFFPQLTELNLNYNKLVHVPEDLPTHFPSMRILRLSNNRLDKIHASSFQNLEVLDLANNDIGYLPPEIGLITTIRELPLYGNRFRVPRPNILDQGTPAVLEFLRRRVG